MAVQTLVDMPQLLTVQTESNYDLWLAYTYRQSYNLFLQSNCGLRPSLKWIQNVFSFGPKAERKIVMTVIETGLKMSYLSSKG